MKKFLFIFICFTFFMLTACSLQEKAVNNNSDRVEYNFENKEVIQAGKNFCIYKENITQVKYDILNSNGEIVFSDTTERPLEITMINDDIVDIAVGMGTGITKHRYYNSKKNLFSEDFLYVVANINELVAYIYVPNEHSFENRTVVVQNIFDDNLYYKEFRLDFSNVDTPVINAEFSRNETFLQLTYLTGEKQVEKVKTLYLGI